MKYEVVEIMFFATTEPVMGTDLTLDEAKKLMEDLEQKNDDRGYRWYDIREIKVNENETV